MKIERKYDLIILDDCLGGLIAGLIVSSLGGRVLCVEKRKNSHPIAGKFGLQEPIRPIIGFHENGIGQRLAKLFRVQLPTLSHHYPTMQLLYGNTQNAQSARRLNLTKDLDDMKWEFKREFPNTRDDLNSSYEKLLSLSDDLDAVFSNFRLGEKGRLSSRLSHLIRPSFGDSFLSSFQLTKKADEPFSLQDFTTLLASGPILVGGLIPFQLPSYSILLSNALFLNGASFSFGGLESIKKSFLDALIRQGAKVKSETNADEILLHRERVEGVVLSSFEGMIYTENIITDQLPFDWQKLIKRAKRTETDESKPKLSAKAKTLSVYAVVNKKYVSEFLGPSLVGLQEIKYGTLEGNLFWTHVFDSNSCTGINPDERLIVISTLVESLNPSHFEKTHLLRVARGLVEQLLEVSPSLNSSNLRIFPDLDAGEAEGLLLADNWLDSSFLGRNGIKGVPIETSVPGLFQVSSLSFPALGLVGEISAGVESGVEIAKRLRLWSEQSASFSNQLQRLDGI